MKYQLVKTTKKIDHNLVKSDIIPRDRQNFYFVNEFLMVNFELYFCSKNDTKPHTITY